MILLVNQHTVPVFIDVVNAFSDKHSETVLFSGHIEKGWTPLSDNVTVIGSIPYDRRNSVTRLSSWMLFSIHYFFYLLLWRKPEKVLVVTNPPITPLLTAMIAKIRGIPFYILIFDLYPDALAQVGFLKSKSLLFRIWENINPWVFKQAEKVFTLSESMKTAVLRYMPHQDKKIKVIHNWANVSYIRPINKTENSFLQKHNLTGKKIIMYSGNMGLTHDLESLVAAADILRSEKNFSFVLIGEGGKKKSLLQVVKDKNLDNVIFLPYQDSRHFPLAIAAADIGVVTLGKGAQGISVPSKTYINLAAGVCLLGIAPGNSELSRLIHTHKAGVICEPGNPYEVAGTIRMLLYNEELLNHYKINALKASSNYTSANAWQYPEEIMMSK